MEVFELVSTLADATPEATARVQQFAQAYELYLNRQFAQAFVAFETLLAVTPHDRAALRHRDACHVYMDNPPPPNWDGVVRMTEK